MGYGLEWGTFSNYDTLDIWSDGMLNHHGELNNAGTLNNDAGKLA
jgi:hypothetical protein